MNWFWSGWGGCHGYGFYGWPTWIFYGAILFVIVFVIWIVSGRRKTVSHNSKSLEILNERYAKGEITDEQYHTMKKKLRD